jgi:hypothetical protein
MSSKVSWLMERSEDGRLIFYGLHEDPPDEHLPMLPVLLEYLARGEGEVMSKGVEW